MAGQGIVSSKTGSTGTNIGLVTGVGLQVAFQVMTSDELLLANIALVRAIVKVGLHMRFDILLSSKLAIAARIKALPFAVGIGTRNVFGDLVIGYASLTY
jgi:hypothetical protein